MEPQLASHQAEHAKNNIDRDGSTQSPKPSAGEPVPMTPVQIIARQAPANQNSKTGGAEKPNGNEGDDRGQLALRQHWKQRRARQLRLQCVSDGFGNEVSDGNRNQLGNLTNCPPQRSDQQREEQYRDDREVQEH